MFSPMERPDLATELVAMKTDDLAARARLAKQASFWHGYHPEMRLVHRRNGDRLDAILDEVGIWPGHDMVGREGSEAAWLIANHDIASPSIMRRARDLITVAVNEQQASPTNLALLTDRIRMFEGSLQVYGTQLGWDDDGNHGIWPPVEDPDDVDRRRAAVGLGPIAEALANRRKEAARPSRLSTEELAEYRRGAAEFGRSVGWRPAGG